MTQQKAKAIIFAAIGAVLVLFSSTLIKNQIAASVLNIIGSLALIESQLTIPLDRQNKGTFWIAVVVIVIFIIEIILSLIKLSL
ncbi:hypothetical protein [uncultured Limosilactobacillus sp.]|uniref:hypothetical protein n=1 Tax=uncultured Limosilactobacillus sp. TaxID=2837629 RepID=UPI0025F70099|nr:hypothetical protein [uncultured Limosilactobacillus sp.]